MLDERLAKEKLEDEAGIYFEYSRARYDESTKLWTFSIIDGQGKHLFRATFKEDFAPYIALSKYLKIPFQKCISHYVWIYGDEIELIPNKEYRKFCYTKKGWIAVSEIIKAFTKKFGTYAKDNLLHNITWKLVIDKNECSSSTYKKSENPGWPNVNTRVTLDFKELEDKIIKCEKGESEKYGMGEKIENKLEKNQYNTEETTKNFCITKDLNEMLLDTQKFSITESKSTDFFKVDKEKENNKLQQTCIVHFDTNGSDGDIKDIIVNMDDSFIFPESTSLERKGYFFVCYSTDKEMKEQYFPKDTFKIPKNKDSLTFYAIWGHFEFVVSEKLNIYQNACNSLEDILNTPVIRTLKQGTKIVLIGDSYQSLKNLWAKVIYENKDGSIECIGFTDTRYLRKFSVTNILIGNIGINRELAKPNLTPNLYSNDIAYLSLQVTIKCYSENLGKQLFLIKIIDEDGILKQSPSSPMGYTDTVKIDITKDEGTSVYNLIAWGSSIQGEVYRSGNYTVEIWHRRDESENSGVACIASKTFMLK